MARKVMVLIGVLMVIITARAQAACTGWVFNDVNAGSVGPVFCDFIEQFSALGITGGCATDNPSTPQNEAMYCPKNLVTREQMAVFITKAMSGGRDNIAKTEWEATVGGGQYNIANAPSSTVAGGYSNEATEWGAAVGGGFDNAAGGWYAAVAGGVLNTSSGWYSAIGGGQMNTAGGSHATVPGGKSNSAAGNYSFAAGCTAKVTGNGSFMWADSNCDMANSPHYTANQFYVRVSNGAIFQTNTKGNPVTGVWIASGGGSWSSFSDRDGKENFAEVDGKEVLAKLETMPVLTWNWKSQNPSIRHMGPVAQDFHKAFQVGEDEKHINTVDADGVALAAIKGLHQIIQEKDAEIRQQREEIEEIKKSIAELTLRLAALDASAKTLAVK